MATETQVRIEPTAATPDQSPPPTPDQSPPAAPDQSPPAAAADGPSYFAKNKAWLRPLLVAALLVGLFFLGLYVVHLLNHESTDNAQLDANIVTLRTSVSGTIDRIGFADNAEVKRGDTLVVFEQSELLARLAAAQSTYNSSELAYQNALTAIQGSDLSYDAATLSARSLADDITAAQSSYDQAQRDLARTRTLEDQGAATLQQLENAQTAVSLTESRLTSAKNTARSASKQSAGLSVQQRSAITQSKVADAAINKAQADLNYAQDEYERAFVIAPFDGVVSNRNVNVGQYVLGGTPLASLVESDELWVTANFKETQLRNIRVGDSASIKVDAYPKLDLRGCVQSIGGASGAQFALLPPDNASGNFIKVTQRIPVRIKLNSVPADHSLVPGYSVVASVAKS